MATPSQEEQDAAAAHLQEQFSEYVQNPCTEKIDALEHAIFVYDAVAAGLTIEDALSEYEDYVWEGGNMTHQMMDAGIICGDSNDEHPVSDTVHEVSKPLFDRFDPHQFRFSNL
jgi:hypothetical protein